MKHRHDRAIVALESFRVGDLVLMDTHNHQGSSKTNRKFKILRKGPYRIIQIEEMHAVLADMEGVIHNDLVSLRKLKLIDGYDSRSFGIDKVHTVLETDRCTTDHGQNYNDGDSTGSIFPCSTHIPEVYGIDSLFEDVVGPVEEINWVTADVQLTDRRKVQNGESMRLIYPLGNKKSGTWVPERLVATLC